MTTLRTDPVEILVAARERLSGHFNQGYYAADSDDPNVELFFFTGEEINYMPFDAIVGDPDTCNVCSMGATYWAAYGFPTPSPLVFPRPPDDFRLAHGAADEIIYGFLDEAAMERSGNDIISFNDDPDTTEADVLAVFDRAIEMAANGTDPFHRKDEAGTP